MFNMSMSAILSGVLFGVVGLYLFRLGKKESHLPHLLIGITLMVYPYFTSSPWGDWGVGTLLCLLAYYLR